MYNIKRVVGALLLSGSLMANAQEIEKPSVKSKTSFAIVVDKATYEAVGPEIRAYKQVVEKDGLGTYIIYDDWQSPEKIRQILQKLHQDKGAPLEGAVLVGNIPVPMIRDAQFLTSAFKMNQKIRWDKSSVPSDRYYDDFDLKFDFLKQDTAKGKEHYFYYSLRPDSKQYIDMDIYSARIKPPVAAGEQMVPKIKDYLNKLITLRSKSYPLNDMLVSYGHGYNSNSVNAVSGEALALKSQLPHLFRPGGSIKFLNFRNADFMKFNLLSELKRDGLDFAYMTGHGTPTLQLINGYPLVSNPQPSMENVARYLRSKMRDAKDDGRDVEKTKEGFKNSLGVSDKWFENIFDAKVAEDDSIFNANLDVQIEDVRNGGIQAKLVYLNSCLTGSFHLDNYIAGYYPFSNNENVAAVANSVGVLQDLWPAEMMGLLNKGYRVGNWLKHIAYLETHVLGDPTFHFDSKDSYTLNEAVMLNKDVTYWKNALKENDADVQSLALVKLVALMPEKESAPLLRDIYFSSPFETTRMEAFQLLRQFENKEYIEVLHAAKNDPYEYIRRRAIYDLTDFGSNEFVKDLIQFYVSDPHSERVAYRVRWALQFMDPVLAKQEVNTLIRENKAVHNGVALADKLDKDLDYYGKKRDDLIKSLQNESLSEKEKLGEVTTLRLYRHHAAVPEVITLIKDEKTPESIRVAALEALGWFTLSYQRDNIIKGCDEVLLSDAPQGVKDEALKTKNRIREATHKI
ncbi:MAG: hypothetical protein LBE37_16575 [Sphingobacterium sp.]|jgi:HEAT repeat protein|nr:hypothetical protein [Sphingobacterium sp.]